MMTERVAGSIAALMIPVGFLVMLVGAPNLSGMTGVLALAAIVFFVARNRARDAAGDWAAAPAVAVPAAVPARGSVPRALGIVEARELLLNPWFHGGLGFCIVFLVAISSFEKSWLETATLYPALVHPLCGLTIVAVFRSMHRPHRDGAAELFEACPAPAAARARAHLYAGAVPVVAAMAFITALTVGSAMVLDGIYGPTGTRLAFNMAVAGVILPAGAVALGVALSRLGRSTLIPVIVVAAIAFVNGLVLEEPDGLGWFATARFPIGADAVYIDPPLLGRLLWLSGLVALMAVFALPRTRRAATISAASVVLVLAGASFLNLRDLPQTTVDRLAGYATLAAEHTACSAVSPSVDVCVPEPYAEHGRAMAAHLEPVARAIPAAAFDEPLTYAATVTDVEALQAQVRDRLDNRQPQTGVSLPLGHHRSHFGEARFTLAAIATGVFTGPGDPQNILIGGQARGVVLLWLGTRGLPDGDVEKILRPYSGESPSHRGAIWPGICGAPIQWAPQDVTAAHFVIAADPGSVGDVIAGDWDRWVDPATPTDELLATLGLTELGPPDPIEPLGAIC